MNIPTLAVVDDDATVCELMQEILAPEGYQILSFTEASSALEAIKDTPVQAAVTDLRLPGMDGVELMERLLKINPDLSIVVITGNGSIPEAVRAMKAGAFDFITKPFKPDILRMIIRKALECQRLRQENHYLRQAVSDLAGIEQLVGSSHGIRSVTEFVRKVSDSESTILIQGESGTGKELVTRLIHFNSFRRDMPLVPVNCGAIPEALLESELFGHEKGAFSGALYTRRGRFEMAQGGTIFLDEVAEIPLPLQVKLLRVLQERSFERVGGSRILSADVRVIAATNRDLEQAVEQGTFRSDLYYRLNVIPITLPPLRTRRTDIILLTDYFISRHNSSKRGMIKGVSPDAMLYLVRYHWPGNVRQLENVIERAVVLKKSGLIEVSDLPPEVQRASAPFESHSSPPSLWSGGIDLSEELDRYENHLIRLALEQANGVTSKAAEILHLNRTTLVEKLKRKGIKPKLLQREPDRAPTPASPHTSKP